jgi:hypothetical protein
LALSSWLLAKSQERKAKGDFSALALFVFRNDADHPHYTLAVDDLALVANLFYGCSYFHTVLGSQFSVIQPRRLSLRDYLDRELFVAVHNSAAI